MEFLFQTIFNLVSIFFIISLFFKIEDVNKENKRLKEKIKSIEKNINNRSRKVENLFYEIKNKKDVFCEIMEKIISKKEDKDNDKS